MACDVSKELVLFVSVHIVVVVVCSELMSFVYQESVSEVHSA